MSSRVPPTRAGRRPVALRFTETMTGHLALGETDPERGHDQGRRDGTLFTFRLTISTDDVDRLVSEPTHRAVARGWVECEPLGGRLPVDRGEVDLLVEGLRGTRTMHYRLWFSDLAGHPLTLRAHKTVTDEPGADVWADTTTLFTQILVGHVGPEDTTATVTAAGILRIKPLHFARQLTTFRTSGGSLRDRAAGLASFGSFFLGQLWRVYAAPRPGRRSA